MSRYLLLSAILLIPGVAHAAKPVESSRPSTVRHDPASRLLVALRQVDRAGVTRTLHRLRLQHAFGSQPNHGMTGSFGMRLKGLTPTGRVAVPSGTSASSLALPQDVLDAGKGTQGLVSSGQGPFRGLHTRWTGYQGGVAAAFNFQPIMDLYYQGSVFANGSSAQSYATESYTDLASGSVAASKDCSDIFNTPCKIVAYVTTSEESALYSVAQVNNCTIETGYQGDPDLINANSDDVSKASADIFVIGVNEAKSACTNAAPQPQPTSAPPVTQPTPVPPAPSPTDVPASGSNGTPSASGAILLFKANGAGSRTTGTFRTRGAWRLDWWYNCSSTGKNGRYALTPKDSGGTLAPSVNRYGWEEHGSLNFVYNGQVFLAIKTRCHWHLKVYGQQ